MPKDVSTNTQSKDTPSSQWQSSVSSENPELLKKAMDELNENPERRDAAIQELREMVLAEEDLTARTDDAFLLRFLRVRKFHVERAFKLLLAYYGMRKKYASVFANYRPSAILNCLNQHLAVMLPNRDQLGRNVLLIRCGKWDPSKCSADELLLAIHMCVETALAEEETQVHGIVVIWDFKDFGFAQALHGTPSNARKYTSLFQDCLPGRFKGFHFIFQPPIFEIFLMVLKPFFSKKTNSRLYSHGSSVESLHKHIHPEFLPEEYGGELPPTDNAGELQLQNFLARDEELANSVLDYGYIGASN